MTYTVTVNYAHPVAALGGATSETREYPTKKLADTAARHMLAGGAKSVVVKKKAAPKKAKKTRLQKMGERMAARHPGYNDNPSMKYEDVAANPDSVHIDINSHNTKGRNVRAKNPGGSVWVGVKRGIVVGIISPTRDGWLYENQDTRRRETHPTLAEAKTSCRKDHGLSVKFKREDGEFNDMLARGRAKNPKPARPRVLSKGVDARPASRAMWVVLKVVGPNGRRSGYWAGEDAQTFDTVRAKARKISALSGLANALKIARKLAVGLPDGWRIEVHNAKD